jgi:predicted secreted protein
MTWPTQTISTANLDAGADEPRLARADLYSAVQSVNALITTVNLGAAADGNFLKFVTNGNIYPHDHYNTVNSYTQQQRITQANLTISSGVVSWNLNTQQAAQITLTQNVTFSNPTNQQAGGTYTVLVKQDGTGGRTITFGNAYLWQNNSAPVLTSASSAVDLLVFYSDGTKMYGSATRNFK